MAGARGRLASAFGGAASEEFDQCDLDGDGKITGRAEAEALRNLVVSGQPGLIATPRQWTDPLVISNVLFALAALQWWCRGYRLQGVLLFGCAVVCTSRRCVACANHAWRADLLYRYAPIPFCAGLIGLPQLRRGPVPLVSYRRPNVCIRHFCSYNPPYSNAASPNVSARAVRFDRDGIACV